ncbi:MAG: hypothetical protein JWM11_3370, partial [Planctomycetaceae bacterium]|nr:hypothetical protein [Planctomycetaceae bacterium]
MRNRLKQRLELTLRAQPRCIDAAHVGIPVDRNGSVLLVVIGLLGMLLLLGIAFYSFSTQEITSAQHFAEAAKVDETLSIDKLWDYALEQLIVGPDQNKTNSALWGRRHALLTGILGRNGMGVFDGFDLTPYDGTGVHISVLPNGDPYVDQAYSNSGSPTGDSPSGYLNFNYSPAATGMMTLPPSFPAPDVDYTRPDLNTLALAFVGRGLDQNGNDVPVIIPSFHRPQYLRQGGVPIPNWPTVGSTATKVMRPHPNHVFAGTAVPRFLSTTATNALGQTVNPFPFGNTTTLQQGVWDMSSAAASPVPAPTYQWDVDGDGDLIKEGIWMDLDFPVQTLGDGRKYVPLFSFTVVDGDGLINLNVSGNQTGLVLQPGGAMPTMPFGNGTHVSRSNMGLSRAEISPAWAMVADPNTDPALLTDGTLRDQHGMFWNVGPGTFNRMEMANSETVFLNIGRPDFSNKIGGSYTMSGADYEPNRYFPGRYDELVLMGPNSYTGGPGMASIGQGPNGGGTRNFSYLPQPGRSAQMYGPIYGDDDNDDMTPAVLPSNTYWDHVGHSRIDTNGYFMMGASFLSMRSNTALPSFVHPLDFWGNGVGLQVSPTGLKMQVSNSGATMALSGAAVPNLWPFYSYGYSTPGVDTTGNNFQNYVNAGVGGGLFQSYYSAQTDEPDEIISEWEVALTNATMGQDKVFGPDVMFELQGTSSDLKLAGVQGRARDLAPFNFKGSSQAEQIRHQFTTLSHDRKNFGLGGMGTGSTVRSWEFNADADSDGSLEFPPQFTGLTGNSALEPFRQVMRQLLYVENNQTTSITNLAQLRLNLNKLLVAYDTTNGPVPAGIPIGMPIYRDLTPHPVVLPNAPITTSPSWNADSPNGASPSSNDQEYWARVDRQRMARDIYVLLYTLGGGNDGTNYTADNSVIPMTNPPVRPIYNDSQLKEMAQFAVNVVDALDRDDVISKFEYDKNLHDG